MFQCNGIIFLLVDTQHNDNQHNGTQYNKIGITTNKCDTQYNSIVDKLSAIYAQYGKWRKLALHAVYRYAECRYVECHNAE